MKPIAVFFAALIMTGAVSASRADTTVNLVMARPGGLPIIITAPHGGSEAVPGARVRTEGKTLQDKYTLEIAEALANSLHERLGTQPYLVAALFSRKFIDANRKETLAFNSPEAKPHYEEYHRRIREYIREIRQNHPGGALLVDIHGQATDNRAIYRGTRHGSTVGQLLDRFGCAALTGKQSIFGVLSAKGYRTIPENSPTDCLFEEDKYIGGFTVASYGSNHADGIDAIQLELGAELRRRSAMADDLAEAVSVFYKKYLAERK